MDLSRTSSLQNPPIDLQSNLPRGTRWWSVTTCTFMREKWSAFPHIIRCSSNTAHSSTSRETGRVMASALATAYLTCYNAAQSFGWAIVLIRLMNHVVESKSLVGGFSAAGDVVCFLQLSAFLEIIHSVLGLVRTGALYAFMQWLGRSHVLFAIIAKLPEVQEQPPVMITFLAWSMSEVTRYPQYALGLVGLCPYWLTWLRYTSFIILYPIGALYGEMLAMYLSLDLIKKQDLYANSFKRLPFDYHSFVVGLMLVYPFLWLVLYLHMFRQRKAKLSKRSSSRSNNNRLKAKRLD